MSAIVQSINCQVFDPILSLELKSHMPETYCHLPSELVICALGDLTMNNLVYTVRFLERERRNPLVQHEISFIYLFIFFTLPSRFGFC
jgi:hypothetical protein